MKNHVHLFFALWLHIVSYDIISSCIVSLHWGPGLVVSHFIEALSGLDISNFYLMTPLKRKEYMKKKKSRARSRAGGHFFMSKDVSFPPQQWSGAQHSTYHENNHFLGGRSRNWVHVCSCARSWFSPTKPQWNGTPPTPDPKANLQYCCSFCRN